MKGWNKFDWVNSIYCGEGADEIFAGYEYLKDLDPGDVNGELKRLTFSSYKNCFQRVDRMLTAFSMEPQLPFADSSVTEYALKLPVKFKLHNEQGDLVEKWVLRKAFEDDLPEDIIWRKKQKFSEGAGSAHFLKEYAEEKITDEQFYKERKIQSDFILRSKEELMYYNIFRGFFPHKSVLETRQTHE
jgi:asparagine synthase (glutamine-hydrolysing)